MKFDIVSFGSAVMDVFVGTDVAEKKGFMNYPVGGKGIITGVNNDTGDSVSLT